MFSIIIPTLNAAPALDDLLLQIDKGAASIPIDEIIISDGGSTDDCMAVALKHGARLALGSAGRGSQLARGMDLACQTRPRSQIHTPLQSNTPLLSNTPLRADPHWFLILHADSQLPADWGVAVQRHMNDHANKAGYFNFGVSDQGWRPRLMERVVALRCGIWKLPYGDQGLLIERQHYEQSGGYPHWPLFEDVKLIEGLAGRICSLGVTLYTSDEKYKKHGYGRRAWANFKLYCRYRQGGKRGEQKSEKIDDLARIYNGVGSK